MTEELKTELKKGDYVVCENKRTAFFAIARFCGWTYRHNKYGAPEFTATLGGYKGDMQLVVYDGYAEELWWSITRKATDDERKQLEQAIAEREITFDGEFYHKHRADISLSQFGDKLITMGGHHAVFIRRADNAEDKLAIVYVEGWGLLTYYTDGRCVDRKQSYYDIARKTIYFKRD